VTDAVGVSGDGAVYWHLPRIRSGAPVADGDEMYHVGKVGEAPRSPPTRTRTRTEASTAHPVFGRPALFSRRASDGELLRARPFEWRGRPALTDDLLLAPRAGRLVAFERGGDEAWSVDLESARPGTPTVAEKTVLVPVWRDGTTEVTAYSTVDGTERWRGEYDGRVATAVDGDSMFVTKAYGADGRARLESRRLDDGREDWSVEFQTADISSPSAVGGTVYATTESSLVALDYSGEERWRVPSDRGAVAATPDTVFHVAEDRLRTRRVDDGSERWSADPGRGEYTGRVSVGAETVYAERYDDRGALVALGRENGMEHWSFEFPMTVVEGDMVTSGLQSRPVVLDGAVYVPAVDGLYAFGPA
jgi:hypothetical protein